MSAGLTEQQSNLLSFIRSFTAQHGFSPSFEQMAAAIGLASKGNIHRLLTILEERGRIRRMAHRSRSIEIIEVVGLAKFSTMDLRRELVRRQEGAPS